MKTSNMLTVVFLLSFVGFGIGIPNYSLDLCKKGESYWCTNYETATQCGVLSYCEKLYGQDLRNKESQPVLIELFYETYCGGCRQFITQQLYPAFTKLYSTGIFDIKLYPYGNADEQKVGDKWEFQCQHGKKECVMNLYETCALHLLSHPRQFMPFINCVEEQPTPQNAEKCAENLQIDWNPIANCYNSSEGNFLQHQMAMATDALKPKHQYVPWIVVNGKHTEEMQTDAQTDLIDFICTTYQGVKPHACRVHVKSERKCYKKKNL